MKSTLLAEAHKMAQNQPDLPQHALFIEIFLGFIETFLGARRPAFGPLSPV